MIVEVRGVTDDPHRGLGGVKVTCDDDRLDAGEKVERTRGIRGLVQDLGSINTMTDLRN